MELSVTATANKSGKVVLRIKRHRTTQFSLAPVQASKLALELLDAAKIAETKANRQ